MTIRLAFAAALALALPAAADGKPWRVSLTGDRFDGAAWHTGVLIELAPGWKTYWRMPGDSGIPPEFTWTPSRPAKVDVQFPAPARHIDKGGETVGYLQDVIFPVTVTPEGPGALDLKLGLFFAVCKDVCIPAQAEASISLGLEQRDPLGSARVEAARSAVPAAGHAITSAEILSDGGKPALRLTLTERPGDIFVESATTAYFHAPVLSADGREARLAIGSLADAARLRGQTVTITYLIGGKGYEQTLTLP
ncbi:protein-disulfide reductase DsbD domain-containing protein [Aestuariivirga sp.]|uniref:protein-disulfide reductase DsbD domain-containing protein n=1 Tax=Aestuariivirga sp. TaxID=2650926 RepID=UPI0025BD253A|nr:protein-disulfide reductase DsbD domain-containing protein [Aestuariivirga sp.]MCA3554886.1 hypothetical protein [Aestuariivirga sp.]